MKKYLLVLVSLCCALLPALAEHPEYPELRKSDANIIGHVLDKKTSEHLPYIIIALKGTTIGTVTDATGHYFLKNLPEGNFVMEVSSVGYKTVTRNVTFLSSGCSTTINAVRTLNWKKMRLLWTE